MNIPLTICTLFVAFAAQTSSGPVAAPSILSVTKIVEQGSALTVYWKDAKWTGKRDLYVAMKAAKSGASVCVKVKSKYVLLTGHTAMFYKFAPVEPGTEYQLTLSTKIAGQWSETSVQYSTVATSPAPVEALKCSIAAVKGVQTLVLKWQTSCTSSDLEYAIEVCERLPAGAKRVQPCEVGTVKPKSAAESTWETKKMVHMKTYDVKVSTHISKASSAPATCSTLNKAG